MVVDTNYAPMNRTKSPFVVALLALAIAMLGLAAAGPAGALKHAPSTVTINGHSVDPVSVYGHVRSPDSRCKGGRKVLLLNAKTFNVIDTYRTGGNGNWRIKLEAKRRGLDLTARVRPKTKPHVACGGARSGVVPAP
jgi:hypothetical protein